jgi:hypothetical protein
MYSIKNKNINIDTILLLLLTILILILIYRYFFHSSSSKSNTNPEKFSIYGTYDSTYAPLNVSGIDIDKSKLLAMNNYSNKISYDLDHSFASNTDGENQVPWDPSSYEEYMEPNGQVVGYIAQN